MEEFEAIDIVGYTGDGAIKRQRVVHNVMQVGIGNILAEESLRHSKSDVLE